MKSAALRPPRRLLQVATTCALVLCALPAAQAAAPGQTFADMIKSVHLVPAGLQDSEMLTKVTTAVGHLQRMELPEAQRATNEALQLDPRNSHLHFLNGFVYHLQARQGDTQKTELALEGYQQALRIDPGNWIAQEFLGLAHMDMKQFEQARQSFSETLLLTTESSVSIFGLMASAYLTGDAPTACAMADQFRKQQAAVQTSMPHDFVRSSVAVYASCGSFAQAEDMRATLLQQGVNDVELQRLDRRVAQWRAFYDRQPPAATAIKTRLSAAPDHNGAVQLAQAFTMPKAAYPQPQRTAAPSSPVANPATAAPAENATSLAAPATSSAAADTAPVAPAMATDTGPRMLLVDVVLLSTQDVASTSKGINLLHALTLQLGSVAGNLPAYSRSFSASGQGFNANGQTISTTITRAVTVPALSYSLNIANATSSVNEVLARPTLAAIEGLPSEFFSGVNLSAGVVSTSQQGGTTIVPLDKRFGIKLVVTPNFLPQGRVQLKVEAQRTSLNPSAENPRAAYQIEIGETTANANVVMKLGDTLVLSGLSEKSSSSTRDGVPGLQDVPVVQYLFSNKKTNEIQRSVLILVTPRAPAQVGEAGSAAAESMAARMQALRQQFGFAGGSPGNVEAILNQMQSGEMFREFRQGDVTMERWDRLESTGVRLREALGFLYY